MQMNLNHSIQAVRKVPLRTRILDAAKLLVGAAALFGLSLLTTVTVVEILYVAGRTAV